MNEENLNSLKEHLKYMGFGDRLFADLEHNIRQRFPEFVLRMNSEFGRARLETTLFFSRPKENDAYSFHHCDAKLKNDVGTLVQSFDGNKGQGITLKEAFNLLKGRAVYKEMEKQGEHYHAWIQLDFRQKEENGNYRMKQFPAVRGYRLEKILVKFPIKEMEGVERDRILMSLQKGNLQPVTMKISGGEQRLFVQANPEQRSLTIFDYGALHPFTEQQKMDLMIPEARQKLNGKEVATDGEQQGKVVKQDLKNEARLLPKNRTGKGKGMKIQ